MGAAGVGVAVGMGVVGELHRRLRAIPDPLRDTTILDLPASTRSVISADGASIGVRELGPEGGPLTVLVHGFVSTYEVWSFVVPELVAAGHRVVMVDQRAHGTSTVGDLGLTLEPLGDDLAAVIESLPEGPITLVGHSMGTISSFALAMRRPDVYKGRVARFVGLSPLARGRGKPPGLELKKHILYTKPYEWARKITPLGVVCTVSALGPAAGYSLVRATYDMYLEASPEVIEHFGRELLTFDFTHVLGGFDCPTTLLVGSTDTKTVPRRVRELAAQMDDVAVIELPNIGHMLPLENPAAAVKAILHS